MNLNSGAARSDGLSAGTVQSMLTRPAGTLVVEDLRVSARPGKRQPDLVHGVSFVLAENETVGLLGPSGAGKTTAALAILGLPPGGRATITGSIRLGKTELTTLDEDEYRSIRGPVIGMVFQDPTAALTPVHRVGKLLTDSLLAHRRLTSDQANTTIHSLLGEVGFANPDRTARAYLHQLSGGMRQRVAIALALVSEPSILIADEPTSSLDAVATDEILGLIEETRAHRDISVLLISHEPQVIDRLATRTVEIRQGSTSLPPPSSGSTPPATVFPSEPPSGLRAPTRRGTTTNPTSEFAIELKNVSATYPRPESRAEAISDVSLAIRPGETLGLVGETGAGKTTVARAALRLIDPTSGQILLAGVDIAKLSQRSLRPLRRQISAVLQHPAASLNPRHRIARIVSTPLIGQGIGDRHERARLAREALAAVDLPTEIDDRLPHELSGGQQQRVALARAIVNRPRVLICDEPFTALDHPLRDQLIDLLSQLQDDLGLACLFIAHDIEIVGRVSNRIAVMKDGKVIETGNTDDVLNHPTQSFTRQLVDLTPGLTDPYRESWRQFSLGN